MKKTTSRLIVASAISTLLVSALCIGSYAALQRDNSSAPVDTINAQQAKEIALAHAGVAAESVRFDDVEADRERGVRVYEIEFYADGVEYEYEVDAATGEVLKSRTEIDDDRPKADIPATPEAPIVSAEPEVPAEPTSTVAPEMPAEPVYIGIEAAKEIALAHAGVAAADARFEDAELDRDDGKVVYELDFYADGAEYEYKIDAISGEILKSKREGKPTASAAPVEPEVPAAPAAPEVPEAPIVSAEPEVPAVPAEPVYIGIEAAKEIALAHAGVSAADARFEDAELDSDDGKVVYELDFRVGAYEYEYEIDASTGKILDAEKELDD